MRAFKAITSGQTIDCKCSVYHKQSGALNLQVSKPGSQEKQKAALTGRVVTGSLAIGAFNALVGYCCLDRTSIGPQPEVDWEGGNLNWEEKATRRESVFDTS